MITIFAKLIERDLDYVVSRSIVAVVVNKLCSELVFVVNAAVATNW